MLGVLAACGSKAPSQTLIPGSENPGTGGVGGGGGSSGNAGDVGQAGSFVLDNGDVDCQRQTCAELGFACGYLLDHCGQIVNCADEGLSCGTNEVCTGGLGTPTQCVTGGNADCTVCNAIPDCSAAAQPTRLTGRVISPGRTDSDTGNQVGVPNAIVYILRGTSTDALPAISTGVPADGTSCDRCEDQDLGPVLVGGVTDSNGNYTLEGNIPVDQDFVLVVKAGKFRRAISQHLPAAAACTTTSLPSTLPNNPTRLPRSSSDGLAVHLPHVAVTTGQIDAMECVLEKMGIAHGEFGNPGTDGSAAPRVHLYRGGDSTSPAGARIDDNTPHDSSLYSSLARLESYDMVVADCEGQTWDVDFSERDADGPKVREFVNRGGRLFASHLSFSWLDGNGTTPYSAAAPLATGLNAAGTWDTAYTASGNLNTSGTGVVSLGRDAASPRIQNFADWMRNEGVIGASNQFNITDPRSMAMSLGPSSEEFVYRSGGNNRVQQFSFDTPYGAPAGESCGRVAYSGFHVAATGGGTTPFIDKTFPEHCSGDLTPQEKVLLYMLFDLGACVGAPPVPPPCTPIECGVMSCGFTPDGCGGVLDCGPCRPPA
jgi:hypothetical protein